MQVSRHLREMLQEAVIRYQIGEHASLRKCAVPLIAEALSS